MRTQRRWRWERFPGSKNTFEVVVVTEDEEMEMEPEPVDDLVAPTSSGQPSMEVDEPASVYVAPTPKLTAIPAKAYPGTTVWRPISPGASDMRTPFGRFSAEPGFEPENDGTAGADAAGSGRSGPDPAPKKARGPVGETRPLAIVLPNGEALWFTTRDIDVDTPRLVIPWSLFQYLAMSLRPLSGFQSWGKVGVVYIRRIAQDVIHGAQQHAEERAEIARIRRSAQNWRGG